MKKCGIYKITNVVNGKLIIGQSTDIKDRWIHYKSHLRYNRWKNLHLQSAWNKYGEQNFKFEIILECPAEKLDEEEIRLIKEFKSNNRRFGYNLTTGGENTKHSEETKRKISISNVGKHNCSDITKKKMSKAKKGKYCGIESPNYGKHLSTKTKNKIRDSLKGKWTGNKSPNYGKSPSVETKKKISKALKGKYCGINSWNYGRHVSKETREKLRKANVGKRGWWKGKHLSEETKKKISQTKLNTSSM